MDVQSWYFFSLLYCLAKQQVPLEGPEFLLGCSAVRAVWP